ncbi:M20 aminoacylase family protein [Tardiphaga alba]|uniref:M20 aminoacylase family protein n=1 Tax=Tardiphaga alba TaxID=340268 RepID=UPI002E2285A5
MDLSDVRAWRHHLHAHPETAFEEFETSRFVAEKLRSFGLEVTEGIGGTGVVGVKRGTGGGRTVSFRADMDALDIQEANRFAHASRIRGKMHACGHDGHTAMLLGAARHLAQRDLSGTIQFVFQPAEENEGGGKRMIEDGLFKRFPADAVFGMHTRPGLDIGSFALRSGPSMASFDVFEITIEGKGTHAARPHLGADPIVAAGQIISAVQSIVSRSVDPLDAAVVSITEMKGGASWNVIPDSAVLRGTTRALDQGVRDLIEARLRSVVSSICGGLGCVANIIYDRRYPVLVNTPEWTAACGEVVQRLVGTDRVKKEIPATMGAEDFAFMLQEVPGCYLWIGNGTMERDRILHNPNFDFNDDALPFGIDYWVALAEAVAK